MAKLEKLGVPVYVRYEKGDQQTEIFQEFDSAQVLSSVNESGETLLKIVGYPKKVTVVRKQTD